MILVWIQTLLTSLATHAICLQNYSQQITILVGYESQSNLIICFIIYLDSYLF